jgi:hypothetical protein
MIHANTVQVPCYEKNVPKILTHVPLLLHVASINLATNVTKFPQTTQPQTHSRVSKRNACPAFRPTRLNSVSIARARDPQASSTPRDSRQHSLLGDDHRCITTHTRNSESLKTFHLKLLCLLQLHSHAPQLRES